jgi:hypothetical protein
MSAAWLPLIVSIIGLVGGTFVYQIQKTVDRRNQVKQERRELYRRFVVAHVACENSLLKNAETILDDIIKVEELLAEIAVTAPDTVVEASKGAIKNLALLGVSRQEDDWSSNDSQYTNAKSIAHQHFLEMVAAMRQDTFEDTVFDRKRLSDVVSLTLQSFGKKPF